MFSVKPPPMLHSYPIYYSRVCFVFGRADALMPAVQGCSTWASCGLASQPWHNDALATSCLPHLCFSSGGYPASDGLYLYQIVLQEWLQLQFVVILPVISKCMRTRAIHSPLHKTSVLYLMPLITSLEVYTSTALLCLVLKWERICIIQEIKQFMSRMFSWKNVEGAQVGWLEILFGDDWRKLLMRMAYKSHPRDPASSFIISFVFVMC